jgi:hypothetical protein
LVDSSTAFLPFDQSKIVWTDVPNRAAKGSKGFKLTQPQLLFVRTTLVNPWFEGSMKGSGGTPQTNKHAHATMFNRPNKRRTSSSPDLVALAEAADAGKIAQDHSVDTPKRQLRRLQVSEQDGRRQNVNLQLKETVALPIFEHVDDSAHRACDGRQR